MNSFLSKRFRSASLFALVALIALARAAIPQDQGDRPWLLSFHEIAFDSTHAYFSNAEWTGYYSAERGLMYTIPRDTLETPPPVRPSDSTYVESTLYAAKGAVIQRVRGVRKPTLFKLPKPAADDVKRLAEQLGDPARRMRQARETIHPLISASNRLWFGLELSDTASCVHTAGIGWFDVNRKRFGKIYDSTLAGCRPQWIGVAADTVNLLVTNAGDSSSVPRLMRYSISSHTWSELSLRNLGLAGESIRTAAVWGDTLLFTTDNAVAIWWPGKRPAIWDTRMYAPRTPIPLYLVTFDPASSSVRDTTRFQTLGPSKLSPIIAWFSDWAQVATADGMSGFVDDAEWRANQKRWSEVNWDCGDSLCFARILVPVRDTLIPGDFMNIPLSYIGKSDHGIKIEFHGAWVRRHDLWPVLMPR